MAAETAGVPLLTPDEAAALLRCSVRTLRRLRKRGELADVWITPHSVRIPQDAAEEFIRRGGVSRNNTEAAR